MRLAFHATRPAQLSTVNQMIHDAWFELPSVQYVSAERAVVIPFGSQGASSAPQTFERILRVEHVDRLRITDKASISTYDINKVTYDPAKARLTLSSGFPLTIEMDALLLSVQVFEM